MQGKTVDELQIGDAASAARTISESDVYNFGGVIGDLNPVHYNEEFAKTSLFGKRVVHGMLTASLLSGVIAAQLPGLGTIYLGLNVKFTKPVFFGDTVTARVEVKDINSEKEIVTLACQCTNQDGKTVLKGEATVLAPPREK